MNYIDAHCHIVTDTDIAAAVHRGCAGVIMNATRPDEWEHVIAATGRRPDVHGAVGVHPWHVGDVAANWADLLRDVLRANPTLMVGEVGLDPTHGDIAPQARIFAEQVRIAHEFSRTLHIHCVGAWGMCLEILRGAGGVPAMVFHGYSGSVETMRELMRYNAYFSFGGAVRNPRHLRTRAAVRAVPVGRILVESDAPDSGLHITDIPNIIDEIAHLRGDAPDIIAAHAYENSRGVITNGH